MLQALLQACHNWFFYNTLQSRHFNENICKNSVLATLLFLVPFLL